MTPETNRPIDLAALGPVLETALDPVVVMDTAGLVADWNSAAERTFGWTREEALGRPLSDLIIPLEHQAAHWAGLRRYLSTGKARVLGRRIDIEALTRAGARFPVELSITEWRTGEGVVFLGFLRDVSDQRRAEAALRDAEARLRATHEHAQVGIGECDREGRFVRVNPTLCEITGYSREELIGLRFADITHPEDRAEDEALYDRQRDGLIEHYVLEKRYVRKDGTAIWVQVNGSAVLDAAGRFAYGVRVVLDITARREFESRQNLLIEELNHRVKNTLATVMSIARQTARSAASPDAFNTSFQARLQALSKTHTLLSQRHWTGIGLADLLETELGHHRSGAGGDRVTFDGPPTQLSPGQSLGVALIIHELATNALKYGALASNGVVRVGWRTTAEAMIELAWVEDSDRPIAAPERTGFGSRLISRVAEGDLQGRTASEWEPPGLRFTLVFPKAA